MDTILPWFTVTYNSKENNRDLAENPRGGLQKKASCVQSSKTNSNSGCQLAW